ncbi:cation diffusion facilitator family transporter [Capnocytophaga felis]|uniref:Cation transporter n=1 Tax=Capnocytophaga felis TaxID=2267611 RepID=A0A5M4BAB3_9FLAO|nr:cation diffusion facilitator family transporter [Capnocytophaga felis]GET46056.1 cation transporter [Capnocytophaga felis]GET48848.1 cation transporter [Capnocytophaga felis]
MPKSLSFQRLVAFVGVVLFIGKIIAWQLTNSDAVFSDAMESTVNIVSAFMGLYALYLAAKPIDNDHPYGHGKVEFVTAGIEGVLIVIAGLLIIIQSVHSLLTGISLRQLDWGIGIVSATAVINYIMGYISCKKGERENSLVLISSGKHLQSDTLSTLGVVLSLLLVYLTDWLWLDSVVAMLFGGYIMLVGYKIVRKALGGIMDEKDEILFSEIVKVLKENRCEKWIDIHNMKVQQFGSHLHIDAHITLPYYYSLQEAHQEMEKVIRLLLKNTDRTVEFNFHMDDCKPFSCEICNMQCDFRKRPFIKRVEWNEKSISQVQKHKLREES